MLDSGFFQGRDTMYKKQRKKSWVGFLCLILLLTGCDLKKEPEATTQETSVEESTKEELENNEGELDEVTLDGMSRDILSGMTREEKVGQMFFVGLSTLSTEKNNGTIRAVTDDVKTNLKQLKPGGVILYSKNMKNQKQTQKLTSDLQENSRIPLFVGTEEAGGVNSRIASVNGMKVEVSPSSAKLGTDGDEGVVFDTAARIGSYMKNLGFNVNFAPCANLTQEETQADQNENSYGSEPKTVGTMASAFINGLHSFGVMAVMNPFPGLGAAKEDTRKGTVDITKTINELRKSELIPFSAGIRQGVDFISVGHASYSSIMGNRTPASLSKLMVTEVLRKELKYESVILTDSMNERAITETYSVEDAAIKAINAGADMLLYPQESGKDAYEAVLAAVNDGSVDESRIEESVLRILKLKIKQGLISSDTDLISSENKE